MKLRARFGKRTRTASRARTVRDDEPDVAVVQFRPRIVPGDQQRNAGRVKPVMAQQLHHRGVQRFDAAFSAPHCAEEPEGVQDSERVFDIGFFPALRKTAQIVHGEFVVYGEPQQLLQAGFDFAGRDIAGQEVRRIAPGDPPGQLGSVLRPELFDRPAEFSDMDRRGETVIFGELRDGPRERPRIGGRDAPAGLAPERLRRVGSERIQFRRIAEVREDRAGFHRRELVFVAEQDETALRPQRIEQFPHQQQRDHRALVDDDQVPRQRVPAVVPGSCRADRCRAAGAGSNSAAKAAVI